MIINDFTKFRVRRLDCNQIVNHECFLAGNGNLFINRSVESFADMECVSFDEYQIEWHTGLTDFSTGNLIYEQDMLGISNGGDYMEAQVSISIHNGGFTLIDEEDGSEYSIDEYSDCELYILDENYEHKDKNNE